MAYKQLDTGIIKSVGGSENVLNIIHYVTWLKFTLNNPKVDKSAAKKHDDIIVVAGSRGQFQFVISSTLIGYFYARLYSFSMSSIFILHQMTPSEGTHITVWLGAAVYIIFAVVLIFLFGFS